MTFQQGVAPAVATRSRSRPALVTQAVGPPLPPALEGLFGLIAEPVLRLAAAPDGQWTVREIGILLGDVLDVLDEDQTIFRAADVLYETAFAVQDARERRSTCVNITDRTVQARADTVYVALAGFRASLGTAKPNARARARHIVW